MSKKLLLADDSVTIQKVIEITFANEDYELTIVGNGDEALEKAKLNPPDLILADIIMPGKSGYELCSEIKNSPELAQAPVLLLAGSFEPFDEEKARSAGADSWIAKPFESQALIEKVKNLLESSSRPVQMPATPPSPSLEEKEVALENIIPLESSASVDTLRVDEVPQEEISMAEVTVEEEEFSVSEEELSVEPILSEEDDNAIIQSSPEAVASTPVELESPVAIHSHSQDPEFSPVESEEDDEDILLLDESDVMMDEDSSDDEASLEREEFFENLPESSFAPDSVEEEIASQENISIEPQGGISEFSFTESDDSCISPEEPPSSDAPAIAEEQSGSEAEMESSFAPQLVEEEIAVKDEISIEPQGEVSEFSFTESDESSTSPEEVPSSGKPCIAEEQGESEAEMEFSFDSFGEEEETEISAEIPEEPVSQEPPVTLPSMEEKPEAPKAEPTYAQMEQKVHSLTDAQLYAIVEKVASATIERMAREIIEQVAWEVVPNLSENIIKEEIQKIKAVQ